MADAQGHISFTSQIPALRAALGPGDYPESYKSISFRSEIHGVVYCYFDYNQYSRGLKAVGTQIATGLYGNGTNLSSSVNVKIGDNLALSGRWFHPGVIYIRFDGSPIVGTVTGDQWRNAQILGTTIANSAGSFDVSVPIPTASTGKHYLSIEDSETRVIVSIYVSYASLSISPSSGPGGSTVQFTGSGYPANQPVTLSYYDSFFGRWSAIGDLTADASGQIRYGTQIPDLRKSASSGDSIETYNTISFRTEKQDTIYGCTTYNEYVRGLKTVGALTANGLYGNGTNIPLSVNAGDSILVSGRWFYPGVVYVRWDGKAVVGTVTGDEWRSASIIGTSIASSTGSFDLTVTVPSADSGVHYISIEDAQTRVIIRITVLGFNTTTPTPTPINRAPTNIDLSCESTASYIGYKVEINGTFSSTGAPVSGEPVQLSYSDTGGSTWSSLTQVYTDSNGCFSALWMPQISGNYLIRASYLGSETLNSTTTIVTLVSTPYSNQNVFSVTSNSTVSALAFNSANNELSFVVSGASATFGYVEVAIAKSLVADVTNIQVYLDDEPTEFTVSSAADAWILHFEYTHSTHSVTVNLAQTSSPTASSRPTNIPSATPPQTIAPTDTPTSPQPTYTPTIPELSTVAIALAIALMLIVTVSFKRWQKTTKQ
jgi:hypothetical protein